VPLRVAFDARLFDAEPTGIGRWTRGLLPALVASASDVAWIALGPAAALERAGLACEVLDTRPRRHLVWQSLTLPGLLARAGADVFLSPWNLVTSRGFRGRQLVWLHDLIAFDAARHGLARAHGWKSRLLWRLARKRLDALVVVSHYTAAEAATRLSVDPARIHVVHPGVDLARFRPPDPEDARAVRTRHGLGRPFALVLGGAEPRKNLALAIAAWRTLSAEARAGHELVLAGGSFRGKDVLDGVVDPGRDGIRDLGRIAEAELPALLGAAAVLLYPSLSEGFGLPPLEAMAVGTPVVAADTTSIPEAVGDAAVLAAPEVAPFAQAITQVLGDVELRADLRARGLARARDFGWDHAARGVLGVLSHLR